MQWPTDLIGFDAGTTYASPSYWAQSLFAAHLGDGTAESSISGENQRFFYSATVSSKEKVLHLKLVNASTVDQPLSVNLTGITGAHAATVTAAWRNVYSDKLDQRSRRDPSHRVRGLHSGQPLGTHSAGAHH